MVSLAFHLFVVGTVIFARALPTVVVHSLVADSSLLDCCDLVVFFPPYAYRQATVWDFEMVLDVQLIFYLVSAVCSHFSFATSICGLVFLSLPQAFVVCSFFAATGVCVRAVSFSHGLFCRRHSCQTFPLALVSGYHQYISQFLVSCCALAARQLHPWRFELEFFPSRLPCEQLYKFRFEANPIWYSAIKFTKSHSAKCSLHTWA